MKRHSNGHSNDRQDRVSSLLPTETPGTPGTSGPRQAFEEFQHQPEQQPEHQPQQEPLLVRPEEAARLLAIGRTTVYDLLRRGELPVIHIGRATRIAVRDLTAWVNRQRDQRLDQRLLD